MKDKFFIAALVAAIWLFTLINKIVYGQEE